MPTNFSQKRILGGVVILIVCLAAGYIFWHDKNPEVIETPFIEPEMEETSFARSQVLGQSVQNRDIVVHTFGDGEIYLLLVGGVHGGYEWNSVLLAEAMIEYFASNPEVVPDDLTISIIPVLNPDGLAMVTNGKTSNLEATDVIDWSADGTGRVNANGIDLNRNFACKWLPQATWRGVALSAGTEAFSEPEARILRDYVLKTNPEAVIFWHSVAGNVYGSECEDGILPLTTVIMNAYATAGNYGAVPAFDAYPITGDAEGWLASIGIPAITVELETRESTEWQRNLAGTQAVIEILSKQN